MRKDHIYWIWHVTTHNREAVQRVLRERGSLDAVEEDTAIAYLNGNEERTVTAHKLGDYFGRIDVLPDSRDYPQCMRLLFQRLPSSGRYWKDLMVHLLVRIEKECQVDSINLAYRGDEYPVECSVGP